MVACGAQHAAATAARQPHAGRRASRRGATMARQWRRSAMVARTCRQQGGAAAMAARRLVGGGSSSWWRRASRELLYGLQILENGETNFFWKMNKKSVSCLPSTALNMGHASTGPKMAMSGHACTWPKFHALCQPMGLVPFGFLFVCFENNERACHLAWHAI